MSIGTDIPAVPLDVLNFTGGGTEVVTNVYLECLHVAWIPGTWNAYLGLASHAEVWEGHPGKFPCPSCRSGHQRIMCYTETFVTDVSDGPLFEESKRTGSRPWWRHSARAALVFSLLSLLLSVALRLAGI